MIQGANKKLSTQASLNNVGQY